MISLANGLEVSSFTTDKIKLLALFFSKNSFLDNSGVSLPVFPSTTNLGLQNISASLKLVG